MKAVIKSIIKLILEFLMADNNINSFNIVDNFFNILYIEYDKSIQENTLKILENFFTNIICTDNAKEGLALYNKFSNINLIITDIQIPDLEGLEMIQKIREKDNKIPIIIISSLCKTEYFLEVIKYGIDGYILKPYTTNQLNDVIINIINKYQSEENIFKISDYYSWNKVDNKLYYKNRLVKLTKNEIKLLNILVDSKQKVISSEKLEYLIFDDFISNNKRIRNLISRFNAKLKYQIIQSIYGQGYKLNIT